MRTSRLLFLLLVVSFITGCSVADGGDLQPPCVNPEPAIHECGLVNQDVNRYYQLRVPSSYSNDTPTPLILDLHGFSSPVVFGLSGERLVSGMEHIGEREGVIVVWPQGIANAWNSKLSVPNCIAPIISFHAPTDIVVAYNGVHFGLPHSRLSAPESYGAWSAINQCTDESEVFFSRGNSCCEIRDECSSTSEVAFCTIDGEGMPLGGHLTYFNNDLVNLSELIWEFFLRHEL